VAKTTFGKEGAKWSRDIYAVIGQEGNRFRLITDENKEVKRLYKGNELQVVDIANLIQYEPEKGGDKLSEKVAKQKKTARRAMKGG
jgi:hypothetical protein